MSAKGVVGLMQSACIPCIGAETKSDLELRAERCGEALQQGVDATNQLSQQLDARTIGDLEFYDLIYDQLVEAINHSANVLDNLREGAKEGYCKSALPQPATLCADLGIQCTAEEIEKAIWVRDFTITLLRSRHRIEADNLYKAAKLGHGNPDRMLELEDQILDNEYARKLLSDALAAVQDRD